jgi:hypothetical protein
VKAPLLATSCHVAVVLVEESKPFLDRKFAKKYLQNIVKYMCPEKETILIM